MLNLRDNCNLSSLLASAGFTLECLYEANDSFNIAYPDGKSTRFDDADYPTLVRLLSPDASLPSLLNLASDERYSDLIKRLIDARS